MEKLNQIEIKNWTYYFYNDMINLKNFDLNLLEKDRFKHHNKKIDDYENIYSANPLYLIVSHASGCIEEKNGNKYLIFYDSLNENKGLLEKYADIWNGIKNKIKAINGGEENNYRKD